MQFVTDGPDIPDALLQAHEEGRVVFFCGAGISYPAGLQDFKWLVEQVYETNGVDFSEMERDAFLRERFDATLDLLERRLAGQRIAVRRALQQSLKPNLRRKGAINTHAALLNLARTREGSLRLVTTNFDRLFQVAARRACQALEVYAAPFLPIPKSSRWNGLVHLHGLLPDKTDDAALNRLVVTSGDFGLAYLTERWASRFVSELFRNFVVCFVGYSIKDPVLRYMMDALAADRMLGEVTPQAWAIGECEPGQEHHAAIEWQAKGVTPILYTVLKGGHDHSALHLTLQGWASIYRDGVLGKERVVVSHAMARPSASTQQDDFVGRMMWALSDKSGLPAKRFADFNPVPPLDWLLDAFTEDRFAHSDLPRFCVPPHGEQNSELRYSLIKRPSPYDRAPPMAMAFGNMVFGNWDDVMFHLARWLVRHLNDPRLILWIAKSGGLLHNRLIALIEHQLNRLFNLECEGNAQELDEIRSLAPNAIPCNAMRTLWRMFICGRVRSMWRSHDLYRWRDRLRREGMTASLRIELRELLTPMVSLKKPFRWGHESDVIDKPEQIRQLVDWEIVLTADGVQAFLRDCKEENWITALPNLLDDFQQLLCDALDLMRELGEANDRSDRSHWDLSSISPHWQNRGYHDWVSLIELVRDAWLKIYSIDNARAARIAMAWFEKPYPTFKRLAFFAASHNDNITPTQWVSWLLSDNAWWLWSVDTGREVYRLLVLQGCGLKGSTQELLEDAILIGPPRELYSDELDEGKWQEIVAHSVWLRLAKLQSSGLVLGTGAHKRFEEMSTANPQWQISGNQRDEFSHWMSGSGDPDHEENRQINVAPRKRGELVHWLKKPKPGWPTIYEDNWRDVCRTRFFHSISALYDLAEDEIWPAERWREALQAWSEAEFVQMSWRYAAPVLRNMPVDVMQEIANGMTWWIEAASKSINRQEDILLQLCQRILALPLESRSMVIINGKPIRRPVTEAINHPVGLITQALINVWFNQNPSDGDQIPNTIRSVFSELCDVGIDRYRHGRVILGSRLIAFYRVDRDWTEQYLFPLFDWSSSTEAHAVWEGFLWSPRVFQPLLIEIKPHFLECANHYEELGEHRHQFASFLVYVALSSIEGYSVNEFRIALSALPKDGLGAAAQALWQAIEGTGDQSEEYWQNRVQPFWKQVWPKSREVATPGITESLTRLIIATKGQFPVAYELLKDWLQPIEHPHYVVSLLHEAGMCHRFPEPSLRLLNCIIKDQQWAPQELSACLKDIEQQEPKLKQDAQYQRLNVYARRHD